MRGLFIAKHIHVENFERFPYPGRRFVYEVSCHSYRDMDSEKLSVIIIGSNAHTHVICMAVGVISAIALQQTYVFLFSLS